MKRKIFLSVFLLLMIMILLSSAVIVVVLYGNVIDQNKDNLKSFAEAISGPCELHGSDFLEEITLTDTRITWIAADGSVRYDNRADAGEMENHSEREEIKEAIESGVGESDRYSDTLMERTFYFAQRLSDGSVLRVAKSYSSIFPYLLYAFLTAAGFLLVAAVLSIAAAKALSASIAGPINRIKLNTPEKLASPYRELAPLVDRISTLQRQIKEQMQNLKRKQEEFQAITENMSEGFLVIGRQGEVVSYNSSALSLFAVNPDSKGVIYAANFDDSPDFQSVVSRSLAGYHTEMTIPRGQRYYQLIANPIEDGAKTVGAVLLVLDVTEKEEGEKLRREFTANVSHELKTPLTSISATAEVLRSGLIEGKDIQHFAGNIYTESKRLIALVNDIIKLSRLDEGSANPAFAKEQVSLSKIINIVVKRLSVAAQEKHLTVTVTADDSTVYGCAPILEDMVYNLCDNAIKYNKVNGYVAISLSRMEDEVALSVKDGGIGIPHDEIPRIFERFYRVDKSHSNEVGGTGLGLSIVKHAALLHGAEIRVVSEPNLGTEFVVTFKNQQRNE